MEESYTVMVETPEDVVGLYEEITAVRRNLAAAIAAEEAAHARVVGLREDLETTIAILRKRVVVAGEPVLFRLPDGANLFVGEDSAFVVAAKYVHALRSLHAPAGPEEGKPTTTPAGGTP